MENTELETNINIAVIYGDGSAGPSNPGFYGSGVHGYIYNTANLDKKNGDRPNKYIISDTGYLEMEQLLRYPNYKTVIPDYYINGIFSYKKFSTNNVAELNAFIEVCHHILKLEEVKINKIIFKTDSMYLINVVNGTNGIIKDVARNWERDPNKPNLDYWHKIDKLLNLLAAANVVYEIVKVQGHSTSLGNHLADRMAFLARNESSRLNDNHEFKLSSSKNYWNAKLERHPFLSFKQLFFTNNFREANAENSFAIMNYKTDVEPGKKTHEACFGLVILKDKQDYIDNAITAYQKYLRMFSVISTVNLNDLYSQYVVNYTSLFGDKIYNFNKKKGTLDALDEITVVNEIRPAGLATLALEKITWLYSILNFYKNITEYNNNGYINPFMFIDVTDTFYGLDEKNKPVTLIKNGVNQISLTLPIDGIDIKFPLELGKDTLERNTLKRLEKQQPKVTLVYRKSTETYLEYFIIIELVETGDLSIWCNFYNNRIFLSKK